MTPPTFEAGSYYTGVGSRETPADILNFMGSVAAALAERGLILRSGGATGADEAFELGCAGKPSQIFVPWRGFTRRLTIGSTLYVISELPCYEQARILAREHHPNWARCTEGARLLHSRNVTQVLGPTLNEPSAFLLCWTKSGGAVGGTGQAIRVAEANDVPVYNLRHAPTLRAFSEALGLSYAP